MGFTSYEPRCVFSRRTLGLFLCAALLRGRCTKRQRVPHAAAPSQSLAGAAACVPLSVFGYLLQEVCDGDGGECA